MIGRPRVGFRVAVLVSAEPTAEEMKRLQRTAYHCSARVNRDDPSSAGS